MHILLKVIKVKLQAAAMSLFWKGIFSMNLLMGSFWVTVFSCFCEWQVPKTTHQSFSVKDNERIKRKSEDQKEIFTCALQNGCSEIGKAQGERLCRSPVLETLPTSFIKAGLHPWHFSRNVLTFFGKIISQKYLWTTDWKGCSFV